MGPGDLQKEQQLPGYVAMRPLREHLPAFQMADEICRAVREHQVTLILGATGCGKTTQIPQFLLEDCASRGEICRVAATQPRRISAVSVADRVAVERGGKLGDTVGFKIRFEETLPLVHPMLGKMLLLAAPFRCFEMMLTICASLGGSAAIQLLVQDYIGRLREDLRSGVREVLQDVPEDHRDPMARAEAVRAVLTAGLFPNLAWLHRRGKGRTLQNLPVKAHPGSVNAKEEHSLVVFYEIQETMDRYLYDSTVVGAAPCLLFAPALKEIQRKQHAIFGLETWHVAVDLRVADELLKLRPLVADFVNAVVGERLGPVQLEAADALQNLFAEKVETTGGDAEDEGEAENDGPDDAWDSEPRSEQEKAASRIPPNKGQASLKCWDSDDPWHSMSICAVSSTSSSIRH
eukprot:Skav236474  [mRNA]  locus=scaffold1440:55805:62630:+ [translate_table: standard]